MHLFTILSSCSICLFILIPLSFWSQMSLRWIRVVLLFFHQHLKAFTGLFTSQTREFKLHMQQSGFQKSYLSLNIYVIKSSFRSPLKAFKSVSRFANSVSVEATHFPHYFLSLVPPLSSACLSVIRLFFHAWCLRAGVLKTAQLLSFTARVLLRSQRASTRILYEVLYLDIMHRCCGFD